jgi:hypothetical protein
MVVAILSRNALKQSVWPHPHNGLGDGSVAFSDMVIGEAVGYASA